MIIDAVENFLRKQISDQGPTALYEAYLEKNNESNSLICEKSIMYLKQFVNHSPCRCIRIIRVRENIPFSLQLWGSEYLHLLSVIAAYHLDKGETTEGLLWADKAISLVDYFAPTLDKEIREDVLHNLPAAAMVCAYPEQYLKTPCDKFLLDWEVKSFYYDENRIHYNDN